MSRKHCGKRRKCRLLAFSPFRTTFSAAFFFMVVESQDSVVKGLNLSQTTNLDSSKLKEFADDSFEFNENGRKSPERAENTVGKGEIARFQKICTADR